METLELKHIAPYLPYGLKGRFIKHDDIVTELDAVHNVVSSLNNGNYEIKHFRPYLYPLDWLTKKNPNNKGKSYIETIYNQCQNFEKDVINTYYNKDWSIKRELNINYLPHWIVEMFYYWHFAVNIPKHLYIDKSTLKDNG